MIARYIPALRWLPSYDPRWLSADFIAGLSVWALLVPQGIAYAAVAGMPPQYGLYAALGGLLGYALFGSSRQVITGPSATVAAVSASAVGLLAASGTDDFVTLTAALAVTAGLVYAALGLLRMGWVSNFLSRAVLGGFIFAFGFGLIVDQSYKILGIPKTSGSYAEKLWETIKELGDTDLLTLAVGATAIGLLLVMRQFVPKWPRALMVVVLGIAASALFDLGSEGVSVVGNVPTGLPSFGWPDVGEADLATLVLGGLAVIFVGFSESLAAGRETASKHGYEIDPSQEMVAQGASNAASGLLGGMVVAGSLSKTTVADLAGQKSQMASLITAGLVLLTVLFLAGIFEDLPNAVLGAVVIDAALGLINVKQLRRFMNSRPEDFAAYVAAGLGVFFIDILAGVVIGVVLSLLLLIAAASRSPVWVMALDRKSGTYVRADTNPDAVTQPGLVVIEINGPLFFADVANFKKSVLSLAGDAATVVIDLDRSSTIDLDGADVLTELHGELAKKDARMVLARVGDDHMDLLRKAGTLDAIGEGNLYPSVREAVQGTGNQTPTEQASQLPRGPHSGGVQA